MWLCADAEVTADSNHNMGAGPNVYSSKQQKWVILPLAH